MMNLTVEVKAYGIAGTVVDMNEAGNVLYVDYNNDWVQVPAELAVEVVEVAPAAAETEADKFEAMLQTEGYDFEGYVNDSESTSYEIQGDTYIVSVTINEDGEHEMETTHQGRYQAEDNIFDPNADTSKAYGNRATRKSLKAVMNFVKKWSEK
jgi:hypothetical protein